MGQSLADLEAQLANVNDAINACLLTGQNYSRTGFSLGRVAMSDLIKLRSSLQFQIARAGTSGVSFISDFSGGGSGSTETDEWGE